MKPIEFDRQIAFDVSDRDMEHPIATGLEPGPPVGAILHDRLGLGRIGQFNRNPVHEGDEIRNMTSDWRLPLEQPGEAAVAV